MAGKKLVVVESPTKSRTLSSFLGSDYQVVATMGHIRDLPKSTLGVDTTRDFKPEYILVAKKNEAIEKLKSEAQKASQILVATDPDREGEAIAWHVAKILKLKTKNVKLKRIIFHEITKKAIEKALAQPGKVDMRLVNAQQARRILDRLVGYKLSPLLWCKVRRGLSAGRVQSVAVRLIVDREREIEKFKAEEYWDILVELTPRRPAGWRGSAGQETFLAKLVKANGKKIKIENKIQAGKVVSELKKASFEIGDVEKKETFQHPAPPFTTSTMQQKAVQILRFSSRKTMRVAQNLYEKGLITYHRTDSFALAKQAVAAMRNYIDDVYGQKYLPLKPRVYKTKSKVAQEAHEAIRPTRFGSKVKAKLGREGERLYRLIFNRAVASQMAAACWDRTKVDIQADPPAGGKNIYQLLIEGKRLKFDGFLAIYESQLEKDKQLPELTKGEELGLVKVDPQQKFTQPPPRYTEATLIKVLEEQGIGRPSTYAPIVSTIQTRQYVEKQEGRFQPSVLGMAVNDFLIEYFPDIFDYQFTAKMEDDLDEIANGRQKWVPVIRDFFEPFEKKLTGVTKTAKRVKVPTEATGKKCPQCQKGQLVIRVGRFGKFISCSRFPDCRYTAPFVVKLEGVKCLKCKSDVVIKKTKKGKQFYGCANWPKCDWASWRKPK